MAALHNTNSASADNLNKMQVSFSQYGPPPQFLRLMPKPRQAPVPATEAPDVNLPPAATVYSLATGELVHCNTADIEGLRRAQARESLLPLKTLQAQARGAAEMFATGKKPATPFGTKLTSLDAIWERYQRAQRAVTEIKNDILQGKSPVDALKKYAPLSDFDLLHPENCAWYFDANETRVQAIVVLDDEDFKRICKLRGNKETQQTFEANTEWEFSAMKIDSYVCSTLTVFQQSAWSSSTEEERDRLINHEYTHTLNEILGLVEYKRFLKSLFFSGSRYYSTRSEKNLRKCLSIFFLMKHFSIQDEIIAVMGEFMSAGFYCQDSLAASTHEIIFNDYISRTLNQARSLISSLDMPKAQRKKINLFFESASQAFQESMQENIRVAAHFVRNPADLLMLAMVPISKWQEYFTNSAAPPPCVLSLTLQNGVYVAAS